MTRGSFRHPGCHPEGRPRVATRTDFLSHRIWQEAYVYPKEGLAQTPNGSCDSRRKKAPHLRGFSVSLIAGR